MFKLRLDCVRVDYAELLVQLSEQQLVEENGARCPGQVCQEASRHRVPGPADPPPAWQTASMYSGFRL